MNDSKNESPALLIRNATLKLEGNTILHDFNWQVERGERWFILGPNGAGKTTLVKMILGMAWPLYGAEVRVLGCRYGSCDINEVRKKSRLGKSLPFQLDRRQRFPLDHA